MSTAEGSPDHGQEGPSSAVRESKAARVAAAEVEAYVQIWSKAVDTQMHFNEMSVKSRQLGLTFVAAALGVGVALLSRQSDFSISVPVFGLNVVLHVSVLIILAAVVALFGVRILDLGVYHRMLRGAVTFGEDFEEHYMKRLFDLEKGMTQAISHYSRHDDAGIEKESEKPYHYMGKSRVTAEVKIKKFYNFVIWALMAAAIFIFIVTNMSQGRGDSQPAPHAKKIQVEELHGK